MRYKSIPWIPGAGGHLKVFLAIFGDLGDILRLDIFGCILS